VGNNLVLITVKTFLNVIQLTLRAVRRGIWQQAGNQESNGDTGNQGESATTKLRASVPRVLPL
jgi:hypothetical protein